MNKVQVMFVGGYGRSGSTLLDILLDRIPGVVAVGELRHLFGRALGDNELCSCGAPFNQCSYWSQVLNQAFPSGFDREKIHKSMKVLNRVFSAKEVFYPQLQTPAFKKHVRTYTEAFEAVYRSIADISQAKVVIDSSKYPLHGLFIDTAKGVDLRTMLLMRDPRAVAHSWQRKKLRPEVHWEKREMPRHSIARSALAWNMSNFLTEKIDSGENFRIQRYEDFIDSPLETIQEIASFATGDDIEIGPDIFEPNNATQNNHTIAGNPIRLNQEKLVIKADTKWENEMKAYKKLIVKSLCWPQMKKFDYL